MPRRRPRNKGGRPTQLTVDIALRLGLALGRRRSVEYAASQTAIGRSTLYKWVERGRAGDPRYATLAAILAKPKPPAPIKVQDFVSAWRGGGLGEFLSGIVEPTTEMESSFRDGLPINSCVNTETNVPLLNR